MLDAGQQHFEMYQKKIKLENIGRSTKLELTCGTERGCSETLGVGLATVKWNEDLVFSSAKPMNRKRRSGNRAEDDAKKIMGNILCFCVKAQVTKNFTNHFFINGTVFAFVIDVVTCYNNEV